MTGETDAASPDADRRRRIDRLLGELLDAPPGDRAARIARIESPALRREVEAMLRDALEESDFLRPGGALSPELLAVASEALDDASGRVIGAYRLLRPIGRGGMGVVYLAERADGSFERQVAVKILRLDGPLTDRRRFLREQRILAGLVHPGIARLYDGGVTDSGDPWFVMEHVDGEPIDRYCDRRGLGVRERLRLVLEVCRAVASAHRRLVVHRDLKPSNILVDGDGNPRLLDFGIASIEEAAERPEPGETAAQESAGDAAEEGASRRLRADRTGGTTVALTLQYASPEQLCGESVSVASDVYQLGFLLYELVAGRRPHELGGLTVEEARRRIATSPPPPSVHAPPRAGVARRDLDAVVMKALAVDPAARHPSAESLQDDLERLLGGRPVSAVPATTPYRARRFLGRHPWAVAAAAAVLLLVSTLVAVFTWRLAEERDATREQAERAEASLRFVADLFRQAGPERGAGPDTTARELLDHGARRLRDRLEDRPLVKARILSEIGSMYEVLGLWEQAEPLLREGLELRREALLGGDVAIAEVIGEPVPELPKSIPREGVAALADSWSRLGRLALRRGELERAAPLLESAVVAARRSERRATAASALTSLGLVRKQQGRLEEAEAAHRRALGLYEAMGDPQAVTGEQLNLSTVLMRRGERAEGRRLLEAALATLEELRGAEHVTVGSALINLATSEVQRGDPERAVPLLERGLEIYRDAYGAEHPKVGQVLMNLGNVHSRLGHDEDAKRFLGAALEVYRQLPEEHYATGIILMNLGVAEVRSGKLAGAESHFRRALTILREHLPGGSREVPLALYNLGEVVRKRGRLEEAEALLTESRDLFAAALGEGHFLVSLPLLDLALLHAERGERTAADALFRRTIEIRRASEDLDPAHLEKARAAYEAFRRGDDGRRRAAPDGGHPPRPAEERAPPGR